MKLSFTSVVFVFSLAISAQASALECTSDTLLNRAAEKVVQDDAEVPTADGLLSLVRRLGSDVAPVFAKVGSIKDKAGFQSWMARIGTKADGPLVCGRAKRGDVRAVVLGVRAGWLNISKDGLASVRLAKGFATPYLVARLGDGTEDVTPVRSLSPGKFKKTKISSDAVVVQLVATGSRGPRPIAEVWLGDDADRPPTIKAVDGETPMQWLGRLRRAAASSELRQNGILEAEAVDHAKRMCKSGRIGHTLKRGDDPQQRLKKRGVVARHVGEALARAQTSMKALQSLERSPSHRLTLVDKRFTDVGIGVAKDSTQKECVVVLLAAWPRLKGR